MARLLKLIMILPIILMSYVNCGRNGEAKEIVEGGSNVNQLIFQKSNPQKVATNLENNVREEKLKLVAELLDAYRFSILKYKGIIIIPSPQLDDIYKSYTIGNWRGDTRYYLPVEDTNTDYIFYIALGKKSNYNKVTLEVNNGNIIKGEVESGKIIFPIKGEFLTRGENTFNLRLKKEEISLIAFGKKDYFKDTIYKEIESISPIKEEDLLILNEGMELEFFIPKEERLFLRLALNMVDTRSIFYLYLKEIGGKINYKKEMASSKKDELIEELIPISASNQFFVIKVDKGKVKVRGGIYKLVKEDPKTSYSCALKNLIIILVDALRADHLKIYNPNIDVVSPVINMLGEKGILFMEAQSQENWTKPSVATLLSSLYPSTHKAQGGDDVLPDEVNLISEILKDNGIKTASFIANGYISDKFGFKQGWNFYRNYVREGRRNKAKFVFEDAISWIKSNYQHRFFIYIHTIDPHVPYIPPLEVVRKFYFKDPYQGIISPSRTAYLLEDIKGGKIHLREVDKNYLHALYKGEITYHDGEMKRFFDTLSELGLDKETAIWITADHGEEFFEHGSVGHGHSLYQELLHVPLILLVPEGCLPLNYIFNYDVGLIDVVPTSLDLLKIDLPNYLQGKSLLKYIRGEENPSLYLASISYFLQGSLSVKYKKWKLIHKGNLVYEVYNLEEDPYEQNNIKGIYPYIDRFLHAIMGYYRTISTKSYLGIKENKKVEIDDTLKKQLRALGYIH